MSAIGDVIATLRSALVNLEDAANLAAAARDEADRAAAQAAGIGATYVVTGLGAATKAIDKAGQQVTVTIQVINDAIGHAHAAAGGATGSGPATRSPPTATPATPNAAGRWRARRALRASPKRERNDQPKALLRWYRHVDVATAYVVSPKAAMFVSGLYAAVAARSWVAGTSVMGGFLLESWTTYWQRFKESREEDANP